MDFLAITSSTPATMSATKPMSGPFPEPLENAMPVLNARLKRSDSTTSTTSSELKRRSAQALESWSINSTVIVASATAPQR